MRRLTMPLLAATLLAAPLGAQTMRPSLDYATAAKIRDTCVAWASERKLGVAVAVFNAEGRLLAYAHMDTAPAMVGDIAQWKGKSAATMQVASVETAKWGRGPAQLGTWEGGTPFFAGSTAMGGVGVSGAESSEDTACGLAGIAAAGFKPAK